ncbi:leucyl aminopeptidase family protein [Allofrancisella guangzhouensis]|uniref:Cytochrome C oxidase subunit II n=1 Tax=Allofrancisella guangzhouensis TaxID=594679 RepID=A0A0A8E6B8_9GAMM|nr:leucyl aminopeptidase family protein [Allofrancisella guangzhouensis]AJC49107.1 cytochrome C oxidase subunit II [Allofrancisella guangzhouensis]MBK2026821.1 leucyl aminopeptidase family protein [Allofrancisella guangzhouensis]MBK2043570.1 leucyl aminopeptidase family protein [Allofrancisella guangzhouensis]MBK2046318.1 leucyl aminopeptidase family protein [Allofrancisella guangzhouensis]
MYISTQLNCFTTEKDSSSYPIYLIKKNNLQNWIANQNQFTQKFIQNSHLGGEKSTLIIPNSAGDIDKIICIVTDDMYSIADLSNQLIKGNYHIEYSQVDDLALYYIGFALGAYRFNTYFSPSKIKITGVKILLPKKYNYILPEIEANYVVRDMISTPAEDMGPAEISAIIKNMANKFNASFDEIVSQELVNQGYMGIYTVGKASHREPRLIRLKWGNKENPKISIVGKGVSFDTGGLDIKSASAMQLMHKDMGGAANAIGLAYIIMKHQLPVHLNLTIPAVENSIDAKSFRPSDIIKMKNGTTVQVTNTDAEGRLILAEPLYEESQKNPDLLIDFTTLTGAARIAVGTEISAFFCNNDDVAKELYTFSENTQDFIWRLPLATCYKKTLKSDFADLVHADLSPYAGATKAALFLEHFLGDNPPTWIHFDMMAWNLTSTAGKPVGGEMMAVRAAFAMLKAKYLNN